MEKGLNTVLMLTDFSLAARKAIIGYLKVHSKLQRDTKFGLLHVYSVSQSGQPPVYGFDDVLEAYARHDLKQEKLFIEKTEGLQNLDIDLIAGQGDLIKVIRRLHEKRPIDLVVMGIKGSNILKQLLFGSDTHRVVQKSKLPVLLIPENKEFVKPGRVVFATDLQSCRYEKQFERLAGVVRFFGAQLTVLGVSTGEGQDNSDFEAVVGRHLQDIPHSFRYLNSQDAAGGIVNFLNDHPADMLVMIEKPGNLLLGMFTKSVLDSLTVGARTPLLVLHN